MSRFRFYILPRLCLGLSVLFLLFGGWVLWLSLGRPLPTMGLACRQEETARLLEGIRCPDKGILLDTGHLMNANTALRTQEEGAAYINAMLDLHGSLAAAVRGVHLHHSLSGAYVGSNTGFLPEHLPEEYMARFGESYSHILRIDQHRPWSSPAILPVLERIAPRWLTHEISSRGRRARAEAA